MILPDEQQLDGRKALVDTVVPTVLFAALAATTTVGLASAVALGWCALMILIRLLRREPLTYAFGGLGGVGGGVALALFTNDAEAFFLPGIIGNLAFAGLCIVSVLARRPAIAYTSAALYRWPIGWYLHPRVRPAYSEATWLWAAYYLLKGGVQLSLVQRDELATLAAVRIITGWPTLVGLLAVTYAYITWRLRTLDGPDVEEFRAAPDGGEAEPGLTEPQTP